jgi:hypothetical protein
MTQFMQSCQLSYKRIILEVIFQYLLTSVTQCEAILRNLGCQLPDAVDELELGDRHGQVEDGVGDPALVLAVHQPDELAAGRIVGQGSNHLSSGTVPSPEESINWI